METAKKPSIAEKVQAYLDDLVTRARTVKEVARAVGCTPEHLSRTLKDMGVSRPPAEKSPQKQARAASSALFEQRKAFRKATANDPTLTPKQAAYQAKCSLRTIYRYRGQP